MAIRSNVRLQESLNALNVLMLKELGKQYKIKYAGKMKKAELIEALALVLTTPEVMEEFILGLSKTEWQYLQNIAVGPIKIETELPWEIDNLQTQGYVALLRKGTNEYVMMPKAIAKTYQKLVDVGLVAKKRRQDLLIDYVLGGVDIYGAIKPEELVAIFNSQNQAVTDGEELLRALKIYTKFKVELDFVFWKEYLVNSEFEEYDFENLPELLAEASRHQRYVASKEEFLKHAAGECYVRDSNYDRLKRYLLEELKLTTVAAEQVLSDINYMCVRGYQLKQLVEYVLHVAGIYVEDMRAEKLVPILVAISNNTRMWPLNANKPDEISSLKVKSQVKSKKIDSTKVGRNDPCPCGSGLKYKKCCGK